MEASLLEQIVINLPNFIFGGIACLILYKQNDRLLAILEKQCGEAQAAALRDDSQDATH